MSNYTDANKDLKSADLIVFILKKWKPLSLITMVAAIASVIVSLSITDKYKSSIILFPKASDPVSKTLKTDNLVSEKNFLNFGEEEEVEQLLQVLHSDEIRNKIIEKYNLANHYKINWDSKYPHTSLYNEFINNISFKKTEYMSIRIDVLDENPIMAADIANDIAGLLDSLMNTMKQKVAKQALKIVEKEYFNLQRDIIILEDSLYHTKNKNPFVSGKEFLAKETERLSQLKAKYVEARVDAEYSLPYKFIVNPAFPAEKKSYPVRWLIVVVSTFSTFILTLLILSIFENYKALFKR